MKINPEAASLVSKEVKRAALTKADIETAKAEQQRALELEQMLTRLEAHRITPDKELPKMEFLFRLFHKPCFPRGELVALSGKAKSGKTFVSSILMAVSYRSQLLSVERIEPKRLHVLWYDTEQSEESTQDILKNRILPMTGITEEDFPEERFQIFNVRGESYSDRLKMLEVAVPRYKPDLVILDGIRDLVADINDGVVAQACLEQLMHLASDERCCIVCILHQNKSVEDRNLRGWIGTELMNKAFEVYSCEKVKPENIFVVEQTHTRKYDLGELMFFRMDADSELPIVCDAPTRYAMTNGYSQYASQGQCAEKLPYMNKEWLTFDENNKPHPKSEELFYEALKTGPLFYSDLQTRVMQLLNCGTQMWNNMFREVRDRGVIVRSKNHDGKAIWSLPASKPAQPQQTDMFEALAADSGDSPSS